MTCARIDVIYQKHNPQIISLYLFSEFNITFKNNKILIYLVALVSSIILWFITLKKSPLSGVFAQGLNTITFNP